MIKRFIAFYIDLILVTLITFVINGFFWKEQEVDFTLILSAMIPAAILFMLKDISGRSIGKRILKLEIIDKRRQNVKVPVKKLILRNIATPIWVADAIMKYPFLITINSLYRIQKNTVQSQLLTN